jgi:hypothetical protein
VIGLLLALALPLPDALLAAELLELLELPQAATAAIAANASKLATQLRKILISVSSALLGGVSRILRRAPLHLATDMVASCGRRAPGSADTVAVQSFAGP